MRSISLSFWAGVFSALLFLSALFPATASFADPGPGSYAEDEILVKMRPESGLTEQGVSEIEDTGRVAKRLGGKKARKIKSRQAVKGLYGLKLKDGEKVEDKVWELMSDPDVEYAQPNYVYHASQDPNDAYFSRQWGLYNTGQSVNGSGGTPGADMHMPDAWGTTCGSREIIVAVIDTGVDYTHPDLKPNLWTNPSPGPEGDIHGINVVPTYSGGRVTGDPMDDAGHGTHVSGIIGAAGNNTLGVVGVNWTTSIMALKFLDSSGAGSTSGAIECIDYAVETRKNGHDVRVINASWGGSPGGGVDRALEEAIKSAGNNGILFVAAAGNESNNNDTKPAYPASSEQPNVISVAATDNRDRLASFSNFGNNAVDVAAPGVNILSTYSSGSSPSPVYYYASGTSMAAPHVSGLVALVLAAKPGLTAVQVKDIIAASADDLSLPVRSRGRVNAAKALANAMGDAIKCSVGQDGAYSVISASLNPPQYGKPVTFYRDGVNVGRAKTSPAGSANPGVAVKRVMEPAPGAHTAFAVAPAYAGMEVQSQAVSYTVNPPEISTVSPASASGGGVITLDGSYFGGLKGLVYLTSPAGASKKLRPLTWTDNEISFRLPPRPAGDYKVYVKNKNMESDWADVIIKTPVVASLSRTDAKAGENVTITGNYFGAVKGSVLVIPAGGGSAIKVNPQTWSDTSITFAVPAKPAGAYKLGVKNITATSSQADFTISQ